MFVHNFQLLCSCMVKDITGQAIKDYYLKNAPAKLWIYNQYGPKEEMPVATYFRDEAQMPELELTALKYCKGKVLDIGAGAGIHSLVLQQRWFDVTSIDISPLSVEIMKARGVQKAFCGDIFDYTGVQYDTLLLLMNGIGLSGSLDGLHRFLCHARNLVAPAGQILLDSSDVAYLYAGKPKPQYRYYGEIAYQYSYKSKKSDWFTWLYVDYDTLKQTAFAAGWKSEILFDDGYDQYLAQLSLL